MLQFLCNMLLVYLKHFMGGKVGFCGGFENLVRIFFGIVVCRVKKRYLSSMMVLFFDQV
jgi:hypothetical protein